MATYGDKAEYVGSGSRDYVYPGQSSMGGKLVIRANSSAEANDIYNYITGNRNAQIVNANGGYIPGQGRTNYDAPPQEMGGYYDDGGGYGGGYAAPPPRQLASSPEWLAYLNALGLEEGQFRADIERQRAFAKSAAEQQIAGLEPQYQRQRGGIAHGAEAAGMARSGGLLKGLADSRARQGQDVSNINLGLGSTLSGLESQLAQKMMDLGARRASQELQLRSQGYV